MPQEEQLKLLVVDDEPGIVDYTKKLYSRRGFVTLGAIDGLSAVDIFEKEKPQICLIDVHMPYSPIDGIETLRRIREIDHNAVCIMVSRITDKESIQKCQTLGAFQYALKPLEWEELNKIIEEAKDKVRNG